MKTWQVICICVAASLPRCGRSEETPLASSDRNQRQAFAQGRRTWTDDTGKFQIEAMLLGFSDGTVSLEKEDGQVIRVPIKRLSPADQQYVQEGAADGHDANRQPRPDDKDAVAALKRLGARMTLDDAGNVTIIRLSRTTDADASLADLRRTRVTRAGVSGLQRVMPNTTITGVGKYGGKI